MKWRWLLALFNFFYCFHLVDLLVMRQSTLFNHEIVTQVQRKMYHLYSAATFQIWFDQVYDLDSNPDSSGSCVQGQKQKSKTENSRCSELGLVSMSAARCRLGKHGLEGDVDSTHSRDEVLNTYIQPAPIEKMFMIVLVDETTRVGGNLVIIPGKPSWALLLSLEPQPAVFTVKRKGGQSGGWAVTEQLSFYVSYFALLP